MAGRVATDGGAATGGQAAGTGGRSPVIDGGAGTGGTSLGVAGAAGGGAGTGSVAGTGGGAAGATGGSSAACPSTVAAPAPLRRLTRFEYNNTVRDLFGNPSRPADALPADDFTNIAAEMSVSPVLVEGYHTLAHDFAIAATKDAAAVAALLGCDPASAGETACRQKLIRELVPRIFRRAAVADDDAELGAVFAAGQQLGGGFAGGVRAVVEVALQSPEFLYRIELGEPIGAAAPGIARPTQYELATRLAYLLWGSTPDPQLMTAAAQGKLGTKAEIATEARRLLADPRAHDVVRTFTFQLMRLTDVDYRSLLGLGANVGFTAEIAGLVLEETRLYIDEVTWQGAGDFRTLLTSPVSFVNGPLAAFYGVAGVTGDGFRKVTLDPARRAGLLTQPSVLARTSAGTSTIPTRRGMLVLDDVLCVEVPPPPPGLSPPPPPSTTLTTRERFEQDTSSLPVCAACHRLTDRLGFAFEHYDAVGRWRESDNGQAIDVTGEIVGTDVAGGFDGAAELGRKLAGSAQARRCAVTQWWRFAAGRAEEAADACALETVDRAFAASGNRVRELLVAITQTDGFGYRKVQP
jgi:hypothetical protein